MVGIFRSIIQHIDVGGVARVVCFILSSLVFGLYVQYRVFSNYVIKLEKKKDFFLMRY